MIIKTLSNRVSMSCGNRCVVCIGRARVMCVFPIFKVSVDPFPALNAGKKHKNQNMMRQTIFSTFYWSVWERHIDSTRAHVCVLKWLSVAHLPVWTEHYVKRKLRTHRHTLTHTDTPKRLLLSVFMLKPFSRSNPIIHDFHKATASYSRMVFSVLCWLGKVVEQMLGSAQWYMNMYSSEWANEWNLTVCGAPSWMVCVGALTEEAVERTLAFNGYSNICSKNDCINQKKAA